jgi:translocation and assembly module TamA
LRPFARLLVLVSAALLSVTAAAQEAEHFVHYRLEIDAPRELRQLLESSLDLTRWQSYDRMTDAFLARLATEARTQVADTAATQGYFSPQIAIESTGEDNERLVRITVLPGEPTRVHAVHIRFHGDIDAAAEARVREAWPLREGEVFHQGTWEAAKKRAAETLARRRYAAAHVASSRATVDPETHSADLEIELEPGPEFFFGELEVKGLKRYSDATVRNLAPFKPGDSYSRELLDVFQRRLSATNYFASAQLAIDEDPASASATRVRLEVIEAPTKRLEVGLGYSTDTLYRTTFSWRDVDVRDSGWRVRGEVRLESRAQGVSGTLDFPARPDGWGDALEARANRTDIQNLTTRYVELGATRRSINERNQPAFGASFFLEEQEPLGAPADTARALVARYEYSWRSTDNLLLPRNGLAARLRLGASVPGASTRTFGRIVGQVLWFRSLTRRDDIALRAEAGAVLASSSDGIPQVLLFRTGGDTTVRGYAFESLGVKKGDAIVGGRYYRLGSAEYTRWLGESWGLAAFVDAGDAADQRGDLKLAVGYGAGLRIRTPVGPFRLDLAYGVRTQAVRVHFSAGLAF